MSTIELRQLRYFSILARELHFGRAADLASVTQSALSQQVAKLEEQVGTRLLNRDRRGVTLTAPGETLRDSVDAIFQQIELALRTTRDVAGHQSFRISVGLIEYADLPFIPPALIRLQALYPDVAIERHEMNTTQQIAALKTDSIDLGFGLPVGTLPDGAEILTDLLLESRWALLMRRDHRLASVPCLSLSDLAHERLIVSARAANGPFYNTIIAHCQSAGFSPKIVYETSQAQVGISLVEQGLGVMLDTTHVFTSLPQALRFRFINGMEPVTVQMFYRLNERDSLILDFIELVTEEARRLHTMTSVAGDPSR